MSRTNAQTQKTGHKPRILIGLCPVFELSSLLSSIGGKTARKAFLRLAISRDKRRIYRSFNKWREGLLLAFGYDPLTCECGATMIFQSLYYRHEHVSLEEDMGNITILT